MENNYVKNLSNVSKKDILLVGGKAANLGEMINAKLPVPKGYVLISDAYRIFVSYNKIDKEIEKLLIDLDNNSESIEKISNSIKVLFKQGSIPENLITEIDNLYNNFENSKLAVRSSATLEDTIETSFAGQYESFLNIKNKEELFDSIKKCWASLWNPEGLSYRVMNNINSYSLDIGVIIQEFIPGEESGVVFTANPINNRRDQILINSTWGLGESIVSGKVTPDQWIINKKDYNILEEKIALKQVMTVQKENGIEFKNVSEKNTKEPSLSKSQLIKLIELSQKVEDYFGYSQDIEWTYYKNNFYLVQSRPITTLFPKIKTNNNQSHKVYVNFLLLDKVLYEPLTPMGVHIWKTFLDKIIPFDVKITANRVFVDVTEILRLERWWDKLKNNSYDMDPITTQTILEVLERDKELIKKQRKSLIKIIPILMKFLKPSLLKFMLSSFPKVLYGKFSSTEKLVKAVRTYGEKQINSIEKKADELYSLEERLKFIEKESVLVYYYLPLTILYYVIDSINSLDKAKKIINKKIDSDFDLHKLEKSLPNNVTTEMGIRLLEIAKILDKSKEKPTRDHPEIKTFLKEYGHRAYLEIDPGISRWREEPEYIINLINSYIEDKSYNEKLYKFYNNKREAEKTIEDICNYLKEKGFYKESKKVRKLLNRYRKLAGIRELPKFIMVKGVNIFRKVLLEIGEELEKAGRLNKKEDIFFIDIKNIRSGKKLQKNVLENRKKYDKELKRKSVPRVVTSTGETFFYFKNQNNLNKNLGIPVSSGIYEGQVRILETPEDRYKLKKGDILVTKATNPTWTPLFLQIDGLITEMGGPMSHGSVVAREYGIPAVSGISDATIKYKDGQIIRINGETGEVELIKS